MPPTVYPFNRRGVVLMLLGSLAFVAGGVWLLLAPDSPVYVARTAGAVRLAAQANLRAGFSPVNIPPVGRQASLQDVMFAMKAHHPGLDVVG